ncbi:MULTISPECIES: hypothetical protein [unclassified Bradyrhizobium]|uniref:hypothetical protein n=1 Tax=unclassified Bradyrhizobium TaxID=2631580 RepID=UPI00247A1EE8|nr:MULTISPECIES: hypothetical protein [unclassified Bradyrhizobium]WGR72265.1 hypothetical protein MTX24_04755 [Bradyrhizobium sp. ISRA426]WGR77099.1 hypothetical protein MTX21_29705 [Bradyrhizobium sp. ISRA430]WGR87504.1 hypothetical protein MTX25_04755 [Bradyrhizobium sp. ISRA432]
MTKSKLFIAAIAVTTAFATPALAQWQSQEPAAFAAQYPNGDRAAALSGARDVMAFVPPMAKSPRHLMPHPAKAK